MDSLEDVIQSIHNSKKTLYILCGLPYSGKTYLALGIVKKTKCTYISIDTILKDLGYDWDSNTLPNEQGWKEVFSTTYLQSQEALKNDSNVLYDSTNHTKISRDALRTIAHEVGADTKVIYIDVPIDVVWKRWEENRINKNRSVVNENLVKMTLKAFEAPTEDEDVLTINNS